MKHPDPFKTVSSRLLVAVVLGAVAIGLTAPSAQAGAPCTLKHEFKVMDEACDAGGLVTAKKVMQAAKKNWEGDHPEWKKCTSCHDDKYVFKGGAAEQKKYADQIRKYIPKEVPK